MVPTKYIVYSDISANEDIFRCFADLTNAYLIDVNAKKQTD